MWPFLLLLIVTGTMVGYLAFSNARYTVDLVSSQLRDEMLNHINSHLDKFLSTPKRINQLNSHAIISGNLDHSSQQQVMAHFWEQVQIFDSVTSIYFGNKNGGLATGGREGAKGDLYIISTENFAAGTFKKFRTDSRGKPIEQLFSMPGFDARARPWYKAAEKKQTGTWSDIYILFTGTDMAIAPSKPVINEQGEMLGVVATDIFLSHNSSLV